MAPQRRTFRKKIAIRGGEACREYKKYASKAKIFGKLGKFFKRTGKRAKIEK